MKKILTLSLVIMLLCCISACSLAPQIDQEGVYKSENPRMRITMIKFNPDEPNGIIVNSDGSISKILFKSMHGNFAISYYDEDGESYIDNKYISGTCYQDEDSIILKTDEGEEIVLTEVSNEYELDSLYNDELKHNLGYDPVITINKKYAKKWAEKVEFYYDFLLENYDGKVDSFKSAQESWIKYKDDQLKAYKKYIDDLYKYEAAGELLYVEKEYELQRSRAIDLYEMCVHLNLSVPKL